MSQVSRTFHLPEVPAPLPCDGKGCRLGGRGSRARPVRWFLKVRSEEDYGNHCVQLPYYMHGKLRSREEEGRASGPTGCQ